MIWWGYVGAPLYFPPTDLGFYMELIFIYLNSKNNKIQNERNKNSLLISRGLEASEI